MQDAYLSGLPHHQFHSQAGSEFLFPRHPSVLILCFFRLSPKIQTYSQQPSCATHDSLKTNSMKIFNEVNAIIQMTRNHIVDQGYGQRKMRDTLQGLRFDLNEKSETVKHFKLKSLGFCYQIGCIVLTRPQVNLCDLVVCVFVINEKIDFSDFYIS